MMPTEEQLVENNNTQFRFGTNRAGQRLMISGRTLTHLSFLLYKAGSPSGNVTYTIRRVSDDSLLASQVLKAANDLQLTATWEELEFTAPVDVDEEVRILCECPSGESPDFITIRFGGSDVKADELRTVYVSSYTDYATADLTYIYTYRSAVVPVDGSPMAQLISAGLI